MLNEGKVAELLAVKHGVMLKHEDYLKIMLDNLVGAQEKLWILSEDINNTIEYHIKHLKNMERSMVR